MKKLIKSDNALRNNSGGIVDIIKEGENNSCFAVIAKCGHVGKGYFVPICFPIMAKDKESAIKRVKSIPRVKESNRNCILGISEISQTEYDFIHIQTDHDAYLLGTRLDEDSFSIQRRRILDEEAYEKAVSEYSNGNYYHLKGAEIDLDSIKTADMYEDFQVLERAFAPIRYGDRLIYRKKVDMDELLEEFYYSTVVFNGIHKNKATPLIYYYEIFGDENKLGLTYDGKDLTYVSLNGKRVYIPLDDVTREYIERHIRADDFARDKRKLKNRAVNFDEIEYSGEEVEKLRASRLERFNRRLNRGVAQSDKSDTGSQPGEE